MSQWTIQVPLLSGESISSWLVRSALTQGCDPLVLTGCIWPKWRIWAMDADRFLIEERLKPLSIASDISLRSFRAATLYPIVKQIYNGPPPKKAVWSWILALGARNTKRRRGLQYCPRCLAEDSNPYYRLQWRFAWHTICERHSCSLLDRCPACGSSIEPHRLSAENRHIAVCATCNADLRNSQSTSCSVDIMSFQSKADCVLNEHHGQFCNNTIATAEWFALAGFFVSLIRRTVRSRANAVLNFLHKLEIKIPDVLPCVAGAGIELLCVKDRHKLLAGVSRLINVNQKQFNSALKESGLTRQGFRQKDEMLPRLLERVEHGLPDKPKIRKQKTRVRSLMIPRPRYEVRRMMAELDKCLWMANR